MTWVDRLENKLEKIHNHIVARVLLVIINTIFFLYVGVWLHEFMHFIYAAMVLHDPQTYIVYQGIGLHGYCHISMADTMLYYIGGIGTGLVYLAVWLCFLIIPGKKTVPFELPVFITAWHNFSYGLMEGSFMLWTNYWFSLIFVNAVTFAATILYGNRLIDYIRGEI